MLTRNPLSFQLDTLKRLTNLIKRPLNYLDYLGGRGLIRLDKLKTRLTPTCKFCHKHPILVFSTVSLLVFLSVAIPTLINASIVSNHQKENLIRRSQSLHKALQDVQQQKTSTDAQLKQKALKEQEMQKQIEDLNKQLQAKREAKEAAAQLASQLPVYVAPQPVAYYVPIPTSDCTIWHSGNVTIDTLINRESGGRTCVTNYLDCYGILQACPGSPLRIACGGNGACQLKWFSDNKLGRYGSWEAALAHSYAYNWW